MKGVFVCAAFLVIFLQIFQAEGSVYCDQCTGCRMGWHSYHDKCYQVSENQLTFDEAKQTCRNKGADLVRVYHGGENKFLETVMEAYDDSECGNKMECSFWIGLSSRGEDNTDFEFTWVDAGGPGDITFSDWVGGSPWKRNSPSGNPRDSCVFIRIGTHEWSDSTCDFERNYFCVMEK